MRGRAALFSSLTGPSTERCDKVLSLVRKPYDFSDEIASRVAKLTQTEVGFDALASFAVPAGFTVAFCCLGHADPSGVSKEEFIKVDVEYVHAFAKLCKASGVRHFSFVSAVNASPKSLSRYGRTKFKAETAVQSVGFSKCSIFRPSILITHGHKNEKLRTKVRVARLPQSSVSPHSHPCVCRLAKMWPPNLRGFSPASTRRCALKVREVALCVRARFSLVFAHQLQIWRVPCGSMPNSTRAKPVKKCSSGTTSSACGPLRSLSTTARQTLSRARSCDVINKKNGQQFCVFPIFTPTFQRFSFCTNRSTK